MHVVTRRRAAALALLASSLVLAACTGSDDAPDREVRYVALGDSAVAGAGIDPFTGPCHRSERNYPARLAEALGIRDVEDVSCPSATTQDVLEGQELDTGGEVPPQIDAVTRDADLVTISIGGNNSQVVPSLFVSCYLPPNNTPAACRKAVDKVPSQLSRMRRGIVEVLEEITRRAPDAQVVLVSYLRIMPDSGQCRTVPIRPDDLEAAARMEGEVEKVQREAAEQAGVDYLSMRGPSQGHDACRGKDQAWVSGVTADPGDGTFLHPRAVGAEAVAEALVPVVASTVRGSAG